MGEEKGEIRKREEWRRDEKGDMRVREGERESEGGGLNKPHALMCVLHLSPLFKVTHTHTHTHGQSRANTHTRKGHTGPLHSLKLSILTSTPMHH